MRAFFLSACVTRGAFSISCFGLACSLNDYMTVGIEDEEEEEEEEEEGEEEGE